MSGDSKANLPWGIQQVKPGSMKTISDVKLATFAVGQQKKSRFQKAREEKEEKKRQEEAEAAKIYDSFVASFAVEEDKTFIRGGRIQEAESDSVYGGRSGDVYKPSRNSSSSAPRESGSSKKKGDMADLLEEIKEREMERSGRSSGPGHGRQRSSSKDFDSSGGQQPIDSFLSEISRGGGVATQRTDGRSAFSGTSTASSDISAMFFMPSEDKGSFDNGDPTTTNLYVGNLAPSVTEELLNDIFGRFGPINSVKVMWPRSEEERLRKRNCGFVSFKSRQDAEDALAELNGSQLEDYTLSIGWGKPVKITSTPFVLPPSVAAGGATLGQSTAAFFAQFNKPPPAPRGLPVAPVPALPPAPIPALPADYPPASAVPPAAGAKGSSTGGRWDATQGTAEVKEMGGDDDKIRISLPQDRAMRHRIDTMAKFVAVDGEAFEQAVLRKEEESGGSEFSFLMESTQPMGPQSQEALYYKWRTYAFLMGDTEDVWTTSPFQMVVNGPFWIPPMCSGRSRPRSDSFGENARHRERGRSRSRSSSPVAYRSKRGRSRSRSRSRERKGGRTRDREKQRDASELSENWERDSSRRGGRRNDEYAGMTGAQIERAKAKRRGTANRAVLREDDYFHFIDILRDLTVDRESIKRAMGFALDNADAYEEVIAMLRDSLLEDDTPAPLKVARMYLLSDILHNSGAAVKNASLYRNAIQACLPDVFHSLNEFLRGISGRMTANQLEERILNLLRVWYDWTIFPTSYIYGLEAVFLQTESDIGRFSEILPADGDVAALDRDIDNLRRKAKLSGLSVAIPSRQDSGDPKYFDGLTLFRKLAYVADFTAIKEAALGLALGTEMGGDMGGSVGFNEGDGWDDADVDGEPIPYDDNEDIDGVSLQEEYDEDVDGVPFDDDDVDGVPLDE